jgi:hypothetical protein
MPEKELNRKRDFYVKPEFPFREVEDIIVDVAKRLSEGKVAGLSGDPDEDLGGVVMDRISEMWMKGSEMKTIHVQQWAAKKYFNILVVDQYRFGKFRDHGLV